MAVVRRGSQQRFSTGIWPGFVDAMTALLLVLMFVLTIFMIVQYILRETITTQGTQLDYLSEQVASLAEALGFEQQRSDGLETEVDRLDGELNDATTAAEIQNQLIATLSQQASNQKLQIEEFEAQVSSFEQQVASLLAEKSQLSLDKENLENQVTESSSKNAALAVRISDAEVESLRLATEKEAMQLALAKARDEIGAAAETARLAAAKREALEALIAETQSSLRNNDTSLKAALAALQERETSLQEALAALDETRENLGSSETSLTGLEAKLAALAAELADSKAAFAGEVQANAELQKHLDLLESGLSDSEKERLAVEASLAVLKTRLEATQSDFSEEEKARLAEAATAVALRQRLANTEAALDSNEKARLEEAAAAEALRKKLIDLEAALTEEEKTRLAEAAAATALRKKLEESQAELTAMTLALEEQRRQAEDTLTMLAAAEVAKKKIDTLLAAALLVKETAENAGEDANNRIAALEAQGVALARDKAMLNDRLDTLIVQLEKGGEYTTELLAQAAQNREELESRLAAALAAKLAVEQDASVLLSKSEQRRVLLAQANDLLDQEKAISADSKRQVALLNQQTATLRKQLNALQALLDLANARDIEAQVQIKSLGANLNSALAQVAAEQKRLAEEQRKRAELEEVERIRLEAEAKNLEKFKSEFFGQLRDLLGSQEGVKIVGDRFVFSSEVLFDAGSADLSGDGQREVAKVADVISKIADQIPDEIDWILRVDGHTDNVPLRGAGLYKDNWELSQARALSVVRFMVNELSMPSDRLAATGFGEFQPLNPANTRTARAQNRRIELKFTEK